MCVSMWHAIDLYRAIETSQSRHRQGTDIRGNTDTEQHISFYIDTEQHRSFYIGRAEAGQHHSCI